VKNPIPALLALSLILPCHLAKGVDDNFRAQVETVIEDFNDKNYDSAISRIDSIKAEGEDAAFLTNLRGAAYTKKQDYAEARRNFEKALELSPGMFAAHFNLGEVDFLQGNYQPALTKFQAMLEADPRNELLQFKVFMSYLLMGDDRLAKRALARIRYPGDTPAWYYANAAYEHKQGNKAKTSEYLSGARYIFSGKTEIFDETFADLDFPRR
jgi:tetratricopeptide (TPR) repeat protein